MRHILACAWPEDHTGPDHGHSHDGTHFDGHVIDGDELLQELARTSGLYGPSPNGTTKLVAETPTATDGAGASGAPPDAPSTNDHNSGGPAPYGPRRCEHGEVLLSTGEIVPEFGGPEPDETVSWCPLWCSRTDQNGAPVDPTEWVYRSVPAQLTVTRDGADAVPATVTIRAEKHPSRPVRLLLGLGSAGVEQGCAMTLADTRRLLRYCNNVLDDLG